MFVDPTIPRDVQELIRQTTPNYMSAAVPNSNVLYGSHKSASPDTVAFVSRLMPQTVFINKEARPGLHTKYQQMMPHEFEHVLQNDVDARYKQNKSNWTNEIIKMSGMSASDLVNILSKSGKNKTLFEHLKSLGMTPSPYLGNASNGFYDLSEQFADLSALETRYNKDLTKDPIVRKEFFNNNERLIQTYKASTGLRQQRLDAKDLPPMTLSNLR